MKPYAGLRLLSRITNPHRNQCAGKHKHKSRGKAEAQVRSLVKRFDKDVADFDIYQCIYCGFFHCGHRREEQ